MNRVFWLVGCGLQLNKGLDLEAIGEVDFNDSRMGLILVPRKN